MTVANRAKPIDLSALCIDDLEIHPDFATFRETRGQLVAGACVVDPQADRDRCPRRNAGRQFEEFDGSRRSKQVAGSLGHFRLAEMFQQRRVTAVEEVTGNAVSFFARRGRLARFRCDASSRCHVTVLTMNPFGLVPAVTPLVVCFLDAQPVEWVRDIVAVRTELRLRMKV